MKFDSPLDELEYWIERLALELRSSTAARHLVALERLCEIQADKIRRDKDAPRSELARRLRLSTEWTALQKRVRALTEPEPKPWKPRVIQGGRAQTGSRAR